MSRSGPLYLDGVALLFADGLSSPLSGAAVTARGAYTCGVAHAPPRSLCAPAAAGSVASLALDYTLPLGPQVDLLQLLRGVAAPLTCVHVLPGGAGVGAPPVPHRRDAVLAAVKQALFCRYRHVRDAAALSPAEEASLIEPAPERRADAAAAVARLFGAAPGGVPLRVLARAGAGAGAGAAILLRQAWLPLPASLSDALHACLRPEGGGGAPLRGRACIGGCQVAVPTESDSWMLTAELAASLQLTDGFVYFALVLDETEAASGS